MHYPVPITREDNPPDPMPGPRLRMVRSMVTMSKTMARGGEAASLLAFDTDCQPIPTVNKS